MVEVTTEGDTVVFVVEGLDKLWSFRSRLELPLAHVTAVEHDPEVVGRWWHGVKVLGTDVPGLFAAGTFYYHGELVFWGRARPGAGNHRVSATRALQEAHRGSRRPA